MEAFTSYPAWSEPAAIRGLPMVKRFKNLLQRYSFCFQHRCENRNKLVDFQVWYFRCYQPEECAHLLFPCLSIHIFLVIVHYLNPLTPLPAFARKMFQKL